MTIFLLTFDFQQLAVSFINIIYLWGLVVFNSVPMLADENVVLRALRGRGLQDGEEGELWPGLDLTAD